jgi:hypothetical protein
MSINPNEFLAIVNHSELLSALFSHFKFVSHPLPGGGRRLGVENEGGCVDVHFTKDGTIQSLQAHLDASGQKALASFLSLVFVDSKSESIGRQICFSLHDQVKGVYRHKDRFQIMPVPPDAPHAPMIVADHPFVLEFKYRACPDRYVDSHRRSETAAQLVRTLNIFCNTPISTASIFTRFFWGRPAGAAYACEWIQEGYGYPGFYSISDEFSNAECISPISLFPADAYYSPGYFPGDYALSLPSSIGEFLEMAFQLEEHDARAFAIAGIWLAQVNELWPRAQSAGLVAVVSAIEALLEKDEVTCSECGQPKFAITKKFKAFLSEHVPDVNNRFPQELKSIYTTRSRLAHGLQILLADHRPWNYPLDPAQRQESDLQRNTYHIVKTAIRNWVVSR